MIPAPPDSIAPRAGAACRRVPGPRAAPGSPPGWAPALVRRACAAGLFACLLGSCALAFTSRAPSDYAPEEHGEPTCTETPGRAVADATLAATALQLGAWWLLTWESELLPSPPAEVMVPVFAFGAGHAASAVYGYEHSLRCKDARWRYDWWRAKQGEDDEGRQALGHGDLDVERTHDRSDAGFPAGF